MGQILSRRRREYGVSPRQMARRIGISRTDLSNLEDYPLSNWTLDTICLLADAYGFTPVSLATKAVDEWYARTRGVSVLRERMSKVPLP